MSDHRVRLTDDDLALIVAALRARAAMAGPMRAHRIGRLADRLGEMAPGNPKWRIDELGQTHEEDLEGRVTDPVVSLILQQVNDLEPWAYAYKEQPVDLLEVRASELEVIVDGALRPLLDALRAYTGRGRRVGLQA